MLETSAAAAAGLAAAGLVPAHLVDAGQARSASAPRLRFAVIGMNHGHIYGMVDAAVRGGGQLVSFHAKEPDLAAEFARKYPGAKQVADERAILEDRSIQLVLSSITPNERAPLGIRVMQHGKDYMVDKPGATSLGQLAEVKRVQAATKRIYSIVYSERFENGATIRAARARSRWRDRQGHSDRRLRPTSHPSARSAGMVLGPEAIRRHHLRHRLAPVRSVPVLHWLDQWRGRRVAGAQRTPPRAPRVSGLRRRHGSRQRRHRLHPSRLVHPQRPSHLGRHAPNDTRHRWLYGGAQERRSRRASGREPPLHRRSRRRPLHRLQGGGPAIRATGHRRRAQSHRDGDDPGALFPRDRARTVGAGEGPRGRMNVGRSRLANQHVTRPSIR